MSGLHGFSTPHHSTLTPGSAFFAVDRNGEAGIRKGMLRNVTWLFLVFTLALPGIVSAAKTIPGAVTVTNRSRGTLVTSQGEGRFATARFRGFSAETKGGASQTTVGRIALPLGGSVLEGKAFVHVRGEVEGTLWTRLRMTVEGAGQQRQVALPQLRSGAFRRTLEFHIERTVTPKGKSLPVIVTLQADGGPGRGTGSVRIDSIDFEQR